VHTKQVRSAEALRYESFEPASSSVCTFNSLCVMLMIHRASITLARGAEHKRALKGVVAAISLSLARCAAPLCQQGWMFTIPFQLGGRGGCPRRASRRPRGRQRPIKIHG